MVVIVTRAGKGSPLTNTELDANFTNINAVLPAAGISGDVVGPATATDNALARFNTATGKLIQDSTALLTDVGTLILNVTGGAVQPPVGSDTLLSLTANGQARIELNCFQNGPPIIRGRTGVGPASAPTAIGSGANLLVLQGSGQSPSGLTTPRVQVAFASVEAWTDIAQGANISFATTAIGQIVLTQRWQVAHDGQLLPIANNTYDIGADGFKLRTGYFGNLITVGVANPPPPIDANTGLTISRNGVPRIEMTGSSAPVLFGRRSTGTLSAPGASAINGSLISLQAGGHDGTNWVNVARGAVNIVAAEAWSPTAQGTRIQFQTTLAGGVTALSERWTIQDDGHFYPGVGNTYDIGQETAAVRSGYFASSLNVIAAAPGLQPPPAVTPSPTTAQIRLVGASGTTVTHELTGFVSPPYIIGRRSNGTTAAPTATPSGGGLMQIEGRGYGTTGWSASASAAMTFFADEAWTDAAQGASIRFSTTKNLDTVLTERWRIRNDGNLTPAATNAYDIGTTGARVRAVYGVTADFSGSMLTGGYTADLQTTFGLFMGRRSNGTPAVPTAPLLGQPFAAFQGQGYTGAGWGVGGAAFVVTAGQDWTTQNQGAEAYVSTTLNGTSAITPRWRFTHDGMFIPIANNVYDIGSTAARVRQVFSVLGNFSGQIDAGRFRAWDQAGGIGSASLMPGNATTSGYIDFFAPAGTRVGYIGFADNTLKQINIAADTGYSYRFNGEVDFRATGATVDDKIEPRGRYWARPAPAASFTLGLANLGALNITNPAAPITITIPPQTDVAWPSWGRMDFIQHSGHQVTFAPGAGVTLNSSGGKRKTAGQHSAVSLVQINPNEWTLIGDIAA
jgi:hypothetical protein